MQGMEGANVNGKNARPTTIPVEEIFPTKHDELIHCLRYDYYGKKIATCSSDQRIKVWEQDASGAWHQTADWKAHKGSIWRVEWVHPRFGSVLISCSFDQSVKVWQETEEEKDGLKVWQKKAEIVDSRDSVVDIKVAPPHEGLRLATCSADGQVRIYEAQDTNNLAHWGLASSFESFGGKGSNCISWNPSFSEPSMIVEGNVDGIVTVWENKSSGAWEVAYQFNGHKGEVLDVSWAPNLGRDCHIIASAARDRTVRLWRLPSRLSPGKFEAHEMAILPHDSTVWQVEWNILGTVLATSTDDGSACVWSSDFYGRWRVVCATTPSGKEMTVPPVSDSGESFELRRTASEGLSLSSLSGRLKEKDKEKEKEKEKESDYLFFGDEKDVFGVGGGGGEESYPSRSVVKQETLIDEELTSSGKKKKTDKTPARSMTLTQKWFGKSNAWK